MSVLRNQADQMAATMKLIERTKWPPPDPARDAVEIFEVGVVMNNKTIVMRMSWAKVRETSEEGLAEYILREMIGTRHAVN